jgi:hypothetical protein
MPESLRGRSSSLDDPAGDTPPSRYAARPGQTEEIEVLDWELVVLMP